MKISFIEIEFLVFIFTRRNKLNWQTNSKGGIFPSDLKAAVSLPRTFAQNIYLMVKNLMNYLVWLIFYFLILKEWHLGNDISWANQIEYRLWSSSIVKDRGHDWNSQMVDRRLYHTDITSILCKSGSILDQFCHLVSQFWTQLVLTLMAFMKLDICM